MPDSILVLLFGSRLCHGMAPLFRPEILAVLLSLVAGSASADWIGEGKPRIGFELEHERAADKASHANSLSLTPGLKWQDGWINMAEIQIQTEREIESGEHQTEKKLGLRLRHDFHILPNAKIVIRGLIGRAFSEQEDFSYTYVEPALKYGFDDFEFTIGYRMVRAIDGSKGHDLNKIRLGPSFDLGQNHEIEFRWVRSWDAHTGEHANDSYSVEYVHKY